MVVAGTGNPRPNDSCGLRHACTGPGPQHGVNHEIGDCPYYPSDSCGLRHAFTVPSPPQGVNHEMAADVMGQLRAPAPGGMPAASVPQT